MSVSIFNNLIIVERRTTNPVIHQLTQNNIKFSQKRLQYKSPNDKLIISYKNIANPENILKNIENENITIDVTKVDGYLEILCDEDHIQVVQIHTNTKETFHCMIQNFKNYLIQTIKNIPSVSPKKEFYIFWSNDCLNNEIYHIAYSLGLISSANKNILTLEKLEQKNVFPPTTGGFGTQQNKSVFGGISQPATGGFGTQQNKSVFGGISQPATGGFGTQQNKSVFGGISQPATGGFGTQQNKSVFGGISQPTTGGFGTQQNKSVFGGTSQPTTGGFGTRQNSVFGGISQPTTGGFGTRQNSVFGGSYQTTSGFKYN